MGCLQSSPTSANTSEGSELATLGKKDQLKALTAASKREDDTTVADKEASEKPAEATKAKADTKPSGKDKASSTKTKAAGGKDKVKALAAATKREDEEEHATAKIAIQTEAAKSKPMFVVLVTGPPASGKGTISKKIAHRYKLAHFSSGDLLRDAAAKGDVCVAEAMKQGKLVSNDIIVSLVDKALKNSQNSGAILDGYPRTVEQAKSLDKLLSATKNKVGCVVGLSLTEEKALERISGRRIHQPSGRTYHTKMNPPKVAGKDDETGEPLTKRADDSPEALKARFVAYKEKTFPVLEHYKEIVCNISADATQKARCLEAFSFIDSRIPSFIEPLDVEFDEEPQEPKEEENKAEPTTKPQKVEVDTMSTDEWELQMLERDVARLGRRLTLLEDEEPEKDDDDLDSELDDDSSEEDNEVIKKKQPPAPLPQDVPAAEELNVDDDYDEAELAALEAEIEGLGRRLTLLEDEGDSEGDGGVDL